MEMHPAVDGDGNSITSRHDSGSEPGLPPFDGDDS